MAAKKKSAKRKVGGTKGKSAAKRSAPKKKGAAKKKPPAKRSKVAAKKKVAARPKAKPATAKPKAAKPMATKPTPATPSRPAPAPALAASGGGSFTAHDVNRGHIFSLHPRVNTGFSPEAFDNARRALADERYATIEAAARAVAERALEISNERPDRDPFPPS